VLVGRRREQINEVIQLADRDYCDFGVGRLGKNPPVNAQDIWHFVRKADIVLAPHGYCLCIGRLVPGEF
jgi:hypothetical protein